MSFQYVDLEIIYIDSVAVYSYGFSQLIISMMGIALPLVLGAMTLADLAYRFPSVWSKA